MGMAEAKEGLFQPGVAIFPQKSRDFHVET